MSGSGQRLFRGLRGFGEGEYTGPGSPNYNYATPEQQQVQDMSDAYTGPAYSDPNRNYVGNGTTNTNFNTSSEQVNSGSNEGGGSSGPGILELIFGKNKSEDGLVGNFVNIFGQIMGRNGQVLPPAPPPSSGVPIWIWLAVPVGLVGVVLLARKKPASVAGYRRRKSRR